MHRSEYKLLQIKFFQKMLKELGSEVNPDSLVLDFGCGDGWTVYQFRKQGLNAFGVDIADSYDGVQKLGRDEGIIKADEEVFRTIDMSNYRIPFADDTFDIVISDQVFEHVQSYPEAIAEIKRVLKPGGSSLHVIPSRYHPIEGHVFVPLATIFRSHAYLAFWAFLGIRNSFQKHLGWREVADLNFEYLRNCTTYYTKSTIRKYFARHFGQVSFVEATFIKCQYGRVHRYLYPITSKFPGMAAVFCTLHSRVVFVKKQEAEYSTMPATLAIETVCN